MESGDLRLVQCVPNFSEGRDPETLAALAEAVRGTPGVALVDYSSDPDHHRSVFTFLGPGPAVLEAALAAARVAVARIDLNTHQGVHPRMGALDVLPFIPLHDTPVAECVELAHTAGARLAAELGLPVFFYEEAARTPDRRNLALVRGSGWESLRAAPLVDERRPDLGPDAVHPTAGAVAVGARGPLTAYNIVLDTRDLEIARRVAERVRERSGGLLGVKALGLWLESQGRAQVSLNITRPLQVPLYRVFELVKLEAARYGVAVAGSELIGAIRLEELLESVRHYLGLHDLKASQVLDLWAAALGAEPTTKQATHGED